MNDLNYPARSHCPVTGQLLQSSPHAKKLVFPDHNIPWDSQISVSIVSPGQEWSRYSSISEIKDKLGWCTLQQRRYVNRLSFFFKSVNNLHGHSLPPYVTRQKRASKNHHTYSYHTLRARTDAYLHSFLPRTIRAWNMLPQEIVLAPSPESFRAQLANKLRSNQKTLATSSMTIGPRRGIPIHTF